MQGKSNIQNFQRSGIALGVAAALSLSAVNAQAEDVKEKKGEEKVEEVVVTGSLIRNVPVTSPSLTIDRAEIDRMGVYSMEDILRRLPQNFPNLNRASSRNGNNIDSGQSFTPDGLGNIGVNLRGLGAGNTLVLIDGRRTATSPLSENGFVNMSNIPASSIERIDIILDGASATYGSDAIGGVINIVTRKDYSGAETNVRYEKGKNGSNLYSLGQMFATNWNGGSVTAVLSLDEVTPTNSVKADHYTKDHRSRGGRDLRGTFNVPGSFGSSAYSRNYALPIGHDGTNWDMTDVNSENVLLRDDLSLLQTARAPKTTTTSLTVNFDQQLTDSIKAFGRVLYSTSENTASDNPFHNGIYVPASNAYNNADLNNDGTVDPVYVDYSYIGEVGSGLLSQTTTKYEQERYDLMLGFNAELPFRDWQIEVEGQFTSEESDGRDMRYQNRQWVFDEDLWAYLDVNGDPLPRGAPLSQRVLTEWGRTVASSDPDVAFNPFGNGSVQGSLAGLELTEFISENPISEETNFRFKTDGSLMELPGGTLHAAFGGEYRHAERDYSGSAGRRGINPDYDAPENVGERTILKPEQTITALFTELSIPLVGGDNAMPGVQSLLLSMSARYDHYDIPDANDGRGATFSNVSPKIGFLWKPVDEVNVRMNWSEAFRAPEYNDLITDITLSNCVQSPFMCQTIQDPLDGSIYGGVPREFGGNPDLNPEVADILTFGIDWAPAFMSGLSMYVNYNDTDYQDRISSFNYWDEEFDLSNPELAPRGSDGRISKLIERPINLSQSISRTIDFGVTYDFSTDVGEFTARLSGTHVLERVDQVFADSPERELEATENGPDTWRLTGSLDWRRANYGVSAFVYYSSSWFQQDTGGQYSFVPVFAFVPNPPKAVDSHTTVDLTGYYNIDKWGLSIQGGVRDLFDADFPFVDDYTPYNLSRVNTAGRTFYLNLRKSFDF